MNRNLYIKSTEYDFLKTPIYLTSFKLIKKRFKKYIIADLEVPINIWYNSKLFSYSKVLIKTRYFFESFETLKRKKSITVYIASFDGKDINNFNLSELKVIAFGELYSD